ncbi:MAG: hypothetical protein ACI90U_000969 [Pseudomonadales bacterium]|jgi:hypothetical protein
MDDEPAISEMTEESMAEIIAKPSEAEEMAFESVDEEAAVDTGEQELLPAVEDTDVQFEYLDQ